MFSHSLFRGSSRRLRGVAAGLAALVVLSACQTVEIRQTLEGTVGAAEATGQFGYRVAMSGNGLVMAVSVPFATVGGKASAGLVRIYERNAKETNWTAIGTLTPEVAVASARFGTGIAINYSGDTIAAGAPYTVDGGTVTVFSRANSTDEYGISSILEAKTKGTDKAQRFGTSIAMNSLGSRIAVGAPTADAATTDTGGLTKADAGAVETFDRASGKPGFEITWNRGARSTDGSGQGSAWFGWSIAMNGSGTTLIVGSPNHDETAGQDNTGRAYHYAYQTGGVKGNGFVLSGLLGTGTGEESIVATPGQVGTAVAISTDGSTVAIGAPGYDSNKGAVGLLKYNSTTKLYTYTKTYKKPANQTADLKGIGFAVDLTSQGSKLIIGAPTTNLTNKPESGGYAIVNTATHAMDYGNIGDTDHRYGYSVAISDGGNIFAVTAPFAFGGRGLIRSSDLFAKPGTPTVTLTSPGNGLAAIAWTAPSNVTSELTTTYEILSGSTVLCTTTYTVCLLRNLTNGTKYSLTLRASNALGTGTATAPFEVTPAAAAVPTIPSDVAPQGEDQNAVAPAPDPATTTEGATATPLPGVGSAPAAVTGVKVVGGRRNVVISWTAPASNGGQPITSYTVTATPGGRSCTTSDAATTSCVIGKLGDMKKYTFSVVATNIVGNGEASAASRTVWTQPKVSRTKSATAKNIAQFAGLKVPATAKFSVKVIGKKSPGVCSMKGGAVIGKASGPCKVRVSVTNKGVTTSKNVVLRTVR